MIAPETYITICDVLTICAIWVAAGMAALIIATRKTRIRHNLKDLLFSAALGPIGLIAVLTWLAGHKAAEKIELGRAGLATFRAGYRRRMREHREQTDAGH